MRGVSGFRGGRHGEDDADEIAVESGVGCDYDAKAWNVLTIGGVKAG